MFSKKEQTRWKGIRTNDREKINQKTESSWYVITGGPGCGKTTMVNLLRERGYTTTIEHARHFSIPNVLKEERWRRLGTINWNFS